MQESTAGNLVTCIFHTPSLSFCFFQCLWCSFIANTKNIPPKHQYPPTRLQYELKCMILDHARQWSHFTILTKIDLTSQFLLVATVNFTDITP